jgi:hypothetical protein
MCFLTFLYNISLPSVAIIPCTLHERCFLLMAEEKERGGRERERRNDVPHPSTPAT